MEHFYALIMAGGGGTRLWPLSRQSRPKQVLALTEERTMIQVTVERLDGLLPPECIFVVARQEVAELLRDSVPHLPAENFIIEPEARNSGPAAALGSYHIARRDPDAIIAVLSADHHIADEDAFRASMRAAAEFAAKGHIVTIGIKPDHASTGFGYIKREREIGSVHGLTAYQSGGFREKPDAATAARFVQSGLYSWNAGMFIWQARAIKAEFERQQPEMARGLDQLVDGRGDLETLWQTFPKQSIDYLIMEKAENVAVIPTDMGWSDVGTWGSLYDLLGKDEQGNARRSENPHHVQIDSRNTLIVGEKMVVTIGVDDLVIVQTEDAILICRRDRAQDVKMVVDALKQNGQSDLI
jgi:mannose-1-phosphate guanylyltransferase